MPSVHKTVISWAIVLAGVTIPLVGFAAGVVLGWRYGWFGRADLVLFVGLYLASMLGITVGFHRLFTHRSFEAAKPVQFALGMFGSMAFQGPLLEWVGRHRIHHRFSDHDGDPHAPHAPHRAGFWGRFRAFWHAHIGWALPADPPDLDRYAPGLRKSRMLWLVSDLFLLWALLGLALPATIGYAFGGWPGALTGCLWVGLVRVLAGHHLRLVCELGVPPLGESPVPRGRREPQQRGNRGSGLGRGLAQ